MGASDGVWSGGGFDLEVPLLPEARLRTGNGGGAAASGATRRAQENAAIAMIAAVRKG
jgi:hypothetical protein